MGRAQHGKTEYKYSYKYKYKYKQWAELNMAKRNTNTLVSRQDIQFFLHWTQHGKTEYKYSYTSRQDIQILLH